MLAEVNSHDWDSLRWLAGSEIQRVYTEVANFKGPANQVDTPNFYDNALVNMRFESGLWGASLGFARAATVTMRAWRLWGRKACS